MAGTVTVGCKLPHGLHLDLGDKRVTVNGANSSLIEGGHGLTQNVDKEFFEAWMAVYKDHPAVKAGHIFAHDKESNTRAQAKERAKEKTGFEGLDQENPMPGIKKADTKPE